MKNVVKIIETDNAPKAIGPYSQGVVMPSDGILMFVSGQLPLSSATGKMVEGDIRLQTHQVIDNLVAILEAGGSGLEQVLRVDIFLIDLKSAFTAMNEVYAERFKGPNFPVRQTVQVAALPLGAPIEMSCMAYVRES